MAYNKLLKFVNSLGQLTVGLALRASLASLKVAPAWGVLLLTKLGDKS